MLHSIISLLLLLGCCFGQEFTCPEDPDNENACVEGDFPNPLDCTTYWTCSVACLASLRNCPADLHFSPDLLRCEDPATANCEVITTEVPTTTATTTTTTPPPTTTITEVSSTISQSTTEGILVNPSIFFAGRTNSYSGAGNVVLNDVVVDRLGDWNSDTFTAPDTGYYFFNLNAGFQNAAGANFVLEDTATGGRDAGVRHLTTSNDGVDASSRDIILYLTEGTTLYVNQEQNTGELYSSSLLETSLAGFSLHNSMERLSTFCAARNSDYDTSGRIDYTVLVSNYTADWDNDLDVYVTPEAGTYFFTVSAGVHEDADAVIQLTVDGVMQAELRRNHMNNNNDFTFARTLIMSLSANQMVEVQLVQGDLQAAGRFHISFSGFLYKPKYTPEIAWSLHKTSSWDGSSRLYPVDYDDVLVNDRAVYNTSDHLLTIPYAGFYYVHLGAGVTSGEPVELRLEVNGFDQMRLRRLATNHNGLDTMSRGGIFYFETGDELRVDCLNGFSFDGSNSNSRLTSFQGFLIYSNY